MIMPAKVAQMQRVATRLLALMVCAMVIFRAPNLAAEPQAAATPPIPAAAFATPPASVGPRMTVFISDLHFGLGKRPDGSWSHKEDFRWSGALKGFLDEMGRRGNDHVVSSSSATSSNFGSRRTESPAAVPAAPTWAAQCQK